MERRFSDAMLSRRAGDVHHTAARVRWVRPIAALRPPPRLGFIAPAIRGHFGDNDQPRVATAGTASGQQLELHPESHEIPVESHDFGTVLREPLRERTTDALR